MKKIISALLAVSMLMILTSCAAKYEYVDGGLVKKGSDIKYTALPVGFEPCGVGKKCGRFGEFSLYRVTGINGEEISDEWMTEEYSGSATTVFTSADVPAFREMSFDVCYVCEEDTGVISVSSITDREEIEAVISALDSPDKALWPRSDLISSYTLKFYSEDHPAVFYSLVYCVCESGNYIYDRAEKNCVAADETVSSYIDLND